MNAEDLPDECPACGEDLTIDKRTDVDMLHDSRQVATFEEHIREDHPVVWMVSSFAAKIHNTIRGILR